MKKVFYLGILGYILFEIANVFFIMPLPGSQEMNSISIAYFLHTWRWVFRIVFGLMALVGFKSAFSASKVFTSIALILAVAAGYGTIYEMAADTMFYQPSVLQLKDSNQKTVDPDRLVLGVEYKGEAKAYPIQFLGYHHQVRDQIGGKPVMVTYCTVCRTGRVFEPLVNGQIEDFRLVGMDHFNAMFEDINTHSWWRQATGEAIAGALTGQRLPEFPSLQTTLRKWIELHPNTLIMQPDKKFQAEYDSMSTYEKGKRKGTLTRRDTASWHSKSWIIGVVMGNESAAYDWNRLQKERIIYDKLDNKPIMVVLSKDNASFFAFERTREDQLFTLDSDTLVTSNGRYNLLGAAENASLPNLKKVKAYQEYWHSWQTFHPNSRK